MSLDLKHFIKTRKIERDIVLIGHGLGGRVMMNLVNDEEDDILERVKAFVLVDSAPIDYLKDGKFAWPTELFLLLEDLSNLKLTNTNINKIHSEIARIVPNKQFYEIITRGLTQSEDSSTNYQWKFNLSSLKNNLKSLLSFKIDSKRHFTGKKLALIGERSEYVPEIFLKSFENVFDGFDRENDKVLIKNSGHYIPFEQPREMMRIINDFILKI